MNPTVLYFVPGNAQSCTDDLLISAGLDHLIGMKKPSVHSLESPCESPGCVFQAVAQNAECNDGKTRYIKSEQTWHACDGGRWWIGWYTDDPPVPACFEREVHFLARMHIVPKLADGNTWGFTPALGLPRGFGLRDGAMCEVEQDKYRHIYDASARLFEWTQGEDAEFEDVLADIAVCLSANYCITKWEVLALQLITEENIAITVKAALDLDDACGNGAEKKTECADG